MRKLFLESRVSVHSAIESKTFKVITSPVIKLSVLKKKDEGGKSGFDYINKPIY